MDTTLSSFCFDVSRVHTLTGVVDQLDRSCLDLKKSLDARQTIWRRFGCLTGESLVYVHYREGHSKRVAGVQQVASTCKLGLAHGSCIMMAVPFRLTNASC